MPASETMGTGQQKTGWIFTPGGVENGHDSNLPPDEPTPLFGREIASSLRSSQ
jgi:hypothetical protein